MHVSGLWEEVGVPEEIPMRGEKCKHHMEKRQPAGGLLAVTVLKKHTHTQSKKTSMMTKFYFFSLYVSQCKRVQTEQNWCSCFALKHMHP